jgi:hypothetical protein
MNKIVLLVVIFLSGCVYPCGPCWCRYHNGEVTEFHCEEPAND